MDALAANMGCRRDVCQYGRRIPIFEYAKSKVCHLNYLTREARRSAVTDEGLNDLIIDSIQDIKGKDIVKLDLRQLEDAPADYFIICTGDSSTQIRAIGQRVEARVKEELGLKPYHVEGKQNGRWVLLDYYGTLVHVFHPETRAFYDLEDLWSDAGSTSYENL